MRVSRGFRRHGQSGSNRCEGYMLLTVVLMLVLILMAAAAAAPDIAMKIRREREAEMIHRGTQYMRAIQHYYKKFGRYPMRIEDLENTNNMRFLRRRYKDPLTGKDFRLLHFGEVQMGAVGGFGTPASLLGGAAGAALGGAFGQGSGASGMAGQQGASPGIPGGVAVNSSPPGTPPFGGVFGGGPIIGVASTSHSTSIREFNKKNHYNDWYFIYDPSLDRGGLVKGPLQPPLAATGGSVAGNLALGGNPSSGPGANPSNAFANSPLQGPGALTPAQPQQPQP